MRKPKYSYQHKMDMLFYMLLTLLPLAYGYMCPEPGICICEGILLNCTCENNQNVSLSTAIDEAIEEVFVKGCEFVELSMGAITFRNMQKVELFNINTLTIRQFALVGVKVSSHFHMENISNLNVMKHGFTGLYSVASFSMHQVAADQMREAAFSGIANIQSFAVSNSNFGRVKPLALFIANVTSVTIENCRIEDLQNMSFRIHNASDVVIRNTTFEKTSNSSFRVTSAERFEFDQCYFGTLGFASFSMGKLAKFIFNNSTVTYLEPNAFVFVNATKEVSFEGNVFKTAGENSVLPNTILFKAITHKEIVFKSRNNSFTCDCHLQWMWNKRLIYDSILNTSYCIDSPDVFLYTLTPILDDENQCVTLCSKDSLPSNSDSAHINVMLLTILLLCYFNRFLTSCTSHL